MSFREQADEVTDSKPNPEIPMGQSTEYSHGRTEKKFRKISQP